MIPAHSSLLGAAWKALHPAKKDRAAQAQIRDMIFIVAACRCQQLVGLR
jgi:hypothetical protein